MTNIKNLRERLFVPNASFTLKEQLGYCGGIFGNCMGQDSVNTFSDKFFRQFMRIKPKHLTLYSNISMTISQQGLSIPMTINGNSTVTVAEK